jgi:hypothetical protein
MHFRRALDIASVWGWPHNTKALRFRFLGIHQRNHFSAGSILVIDDPKRTDDKRTTQNEP